MAGLTCHVLFLADEGWLLVLTGRQGFPSCRSSAEPPALGRAAGLEPVATQ